MHSLCLENKGQLLFLMAGGLTNVPTKKLNLIPHLFCRSAISEVMCDLLRGKGIQVRNSTLDLQDYL